MRIPIRFLVVLLASGVTLAHGQAPRVESSSAAFPLSKVLAEEFSRVTSGSFKHSLGNSGSAAAIGRLCAGNAELAVLSRPILKDEIARCQAAKAAFVEVPIALDAVAVVVNPRNAFVVSLSVEDLRRIWTPDAQQKLTRWNQVNPQYPDAPLKLYSLDGNAERGDTFNEAVLGSGKAARRDVTGSADDHVLVRAIARDSNALGYLPLAFYASNKNRLKVVPIAASGGAVPISPSQETVRSGQYQPLARALFLYARTDALERPEAMALAEFYLRNAGRAASELGYVPLTDRTYELGLQRLRQRVAGSAWGGVVPVGATLEAVEQRLSTN